MNPPGSRRRGGRLRRRPGGRRTGPTTPGDEKFWVFFGRARGERAGNRPKSPARDPSGAGKKGRMATRELRGARTPPSGRPF